MGGCRGPTKGANQRDIWSWQTNEKGWKYWVFSGFADTGKGLNCTHALFHLPL